MGVMGRDSQGCVQMWEGYEGVRKALGMRLNSACSNGLRWLAMQRCSPGLDPSRLALQRRLHIGKLQQLLFRAQDEAHVLACAGHPLGAWIRAVIHGCLPCRVGWSCEPPEGRRVAVLSARRASRLRAGTRGLQRYSQLKSRAFTPCMRTSTT